MTEQEYLQNDLYISLINSTVNTLKVILLDQIRTKNEKINKNGKNAHLFKHYTRAHKQYYFYIPGVKDIILKWLDSKEFVDNFN